VDTPFAQDIVEPASPGTERRVHVESTTIRIHDLRIDRQAIAAYLNAIAPEKQEIALIHALEVGVTEMIARRARFRPS